MSETNLVDVLEEYAIAAPEKNDQQVLRSMIEKYPHFDTELEDFAAARAVVRYAPEPEFSAVEEARYQEIGLNNLHTVLSEKAAQQPALQSLTDAAKVKGLNRSKFAAALGLSVSLVQYLEKRRLDFASIPKAVVAKVAEVLQTGEDAIAGYLNQPPNFAPGASYKTNARPEEMQPKSFAEAVREDQQLSAEEKRKLINLTGQ
jgi:transcriptional regulator with XRE-family HTH domain